MVAVFIDMKTLSTLFFCIMSCSPLLAYTDRGEVICQLSESIKAGVTLRDNMCITEEVGTHKYEYYTQNLSDGNTKVLKLDYKKKSGEYVLQNYYAVYILELDGDIEEKEFDGHGDVTQGTRTVTTFDGELAVRIDEQVWKKNSWELSGYSVCEYDQTQDASSILGSQATNKKVLTVKKYDSQDILLSTETYFYTSLSAEDNNDPDSGSKIDGISQLGSENGEMISIGGFRDNDLRLGRILIKNGKKIINK